MRHGGRAKGVNLLRCYLLFRHHHTGHVCQNRFTGWEAIRWNLLCLLLSPPLVHLKRHNSLIEPCADPIMVFLREPVHLTTSCWGWCLAKRHHLNLNSSSFFFRSGMRRRAEHQINFHLSNYAQQLKVRRLMRKQKKHPFPNNRHEHSVGWCWTTGIKRQIKSKFII